jgi:autoinducer 2-degrading protein
MVAAVPPRGTGYHRGRRLSAVEEEPAMHALVISIHVKPGKADEFVALARDNIRETLKESGVVRFDLLQQADDPDRFMLFEVYRDPGDHAAHKLTPHYRAWNLAAEPLMAEPRSRTVYSSVFPQESGWA